MPRPPAPGQPFALGRAETDEIVKRAKLTGESVDDLAAQRRNGPA
ncbi:hypothetical protein [Roseovarius sp. SYSU LYC5161]